MQVEFGVSRKIFYFPLTRNFGFPCFLFPGKGVFLICFYYKGYIKKKNGKAGYVKTANKIIIVK